MPARVSPVGEWVKSRMVRATAESMMHLRQVELTGASSGIRQTGDAVEEGFQ